MWYYQQGSNRMGPVDEATVRQLINAGTITIDTLVWTTDMANWAPLQQTPLAVGLATPPPLAAPVLPSAQPKSKVGYILLGIFLGHLGIHNFYAGYNDRGLTQLLIAVLTCGIGAIATWIWAIVDVCTVHQDANGVTFE